MPLINVKLIDGVFSPAQKKQIAERLTDAMVSIEGEAMRGVTWVVVEEVQSGDWAVGGKLLTTADVHAMGGRKRPDVAARCFDQRLARTAGPRRGAQPLRNAPAPHTTPISSTDCVARSIARLERPPGNARRARPVIQRRKQRDNACRRAAALYSLRAVYHRIGATCAPYLRS